MKINTICAAFFSPTDTTKKIVTTIANTLASSLDLPCELFDFTLLAAREKIKTFSPDTLVVFGTPVYAGRVPNILLKYLDTIQGNGAAAVSVVLYGNRNFDDALIELRDILEIDGFHTVAAGAFIGEHSFSKILAGGRPDVSDIEKAENFAKCVAQKLADHATISDIPQIAVEGNLKPYGKGYYRPLGPSGEFIDIRKVKPLTNQDCINCKICVAVCPMGSISAENVHEFTGICIKCGACIKKCPVHAKYFADEGYLFHKEDLEKRFVRRAEPQTFL
ncbi:MAG: EFR1 family ferrodoxin [Candidatus Fimivivens sp.]